MKHTDRTTACNIARAMRGDIGRRVMFRYNGKIRVGKLLDVCVSGVSPLFTPYVDLDELPGEEHPKRFRLDRMESSFSCL